MTENGMKLRNWVIEKIRKEYPEDIDLLIAHGDHEVNGDDHGISFDYFVPANEWGYELTRTFIIDGIGYDLYPRSWERLAATADCNNDGEFTLIHGEIVYARNEAVKMRYLALQQRLRAHLKDQLFCYRKALELLDTAMNIYSTVMFEGRLTRAKLGGGYIIDYLNQAIAFLNGKIAVIYADEILSLPNLPQSYNDYREKLMGAASVEEIRLAAHLLLDTVRAEIKAHQPQSIAAKKEIDYRPLADWYQELCLTWRRIDWYCEIGDVAKAFYDACYLQSEHNAIEEEFGLNEMDLLSVFDVNDLSALRERAKETEQELVLVMESHGVKIDRYDTMDDFLSCN